tara:strand:+ start:125 stop:322 length:198 start_codon:yes stop_codon:yes gene_type:complete
MEKEIIIAESMAINVTDAVLMVPLLIVVGGLGVAIGIYISSQLKCHIRKNINRKNLEEYEKKKTK